MASREWQGGQGTLAVVGTGSERHQSRCGARGITIQQQAIACMAVVSFPRVAPKWIDMTLLSGALVHEARSPHSCQLTSGAADGVADCAMARYQLELAYGLRMVR